MLSIMNISVVNPRIIREGACRDRTEVASGAHPLLLAGCCAPLLHAHAGASPPLRAVWRLLQNELLLPAVRSGEQRPPVAVDERCKEERGRRTVRCQGFSKRAAIFGLEFELRHHRLR